MTLFNIRATHPYGFRSGEWAEVIGINWVKGRPCFNVRFIDNVTDEWPVYDPSDPYEFRKVIFPPTFEKSYGLTTDEIINTDSIAAEFRKNIKENNND